MKTLAASSILFCALALVLLPGISAAQSTNGVTLDGIFAGSSGTPITFPAAEWGCLHGDPQASEIYDFGPGATPANATVHGIWDGVIAVDFSPVVVTYSTPGVKTFTLTTVLAGRSPGMDTFILHIFDCGNPSIPHDAIVINSDTTVTLGPLQPSMTYWVNPGVVLNLNTTAGYDSIFTIFAEPGSTISGAPFYSVLYMKHGSVLNSSSGYKSVISGDGASINSSSTDFTLHCPTLDFDYSNAPPNPAHPLASVKDNLNSVSLTLSPNPTGGMLSVQGLPSDNITVSVFNILGETVMVQKNPPAPDFTLDLSKLVPGTYYIRFSSANSVVTKAIIKN